MSRSPTRRLPPSGAVPPTAGNPALVKIGLVEFARKLHALRTARGWNQSDLAREVWGEVEDPNGRMVARNRDRISRYEKALSFPEPDNLTALARVLNVTPEELAPGATAAAVEREVPAVSMVSAHGHPDKTHLQINVLIPLDVAIRIAAIVNAALITGSALAPEGEDTAL